MKRLPILWSTSAACVLWLGGCQGESSKLDPPDCPPAWRAAGDATWYRTGSPTACLLNPQSGLTAAISSEDYAQSGHCGECLEVFGPKGSVVVTITDRCPACGAGDLDLSPQAFARLARRDTGRIAVTWRRVACPVEGALAYRLQGSNPYYLKLEALGHRYGIAALDWFDPESGHWLPMQRTSDNHFELSMPRPIRDGWKVRATATTGEQLVTRLSGIDNGKRMPGNGQFSSCE